MGKNDRLYAILGIAVIGGVILAIFIFGEHFVQKAVGALLGWVLIRDIIANTGLIPASSPLSILFANHAHKPSDDLAKNVAAEVAVLLRPTAVPPRTESVSVDLLLALLTRYVKLTGDISYGRQTVVESRYYVNTMEASHSEADLELMVRLVGRLVLQSRNHVMPDFIVTPKAGNPLLAQAFHVAYQIPFVLRKSRGDKSRAQSATDEADLRLWVNFEGAHALQRRARESRQEGRSLYGVAIDCNTSGGSEILESMQEFNDVVAVPNSGIESVSEAYVLFRPDRATNIDERFRQKVSASSAISISTKGSRRSWRRRERSPIPTPKRTSSGCSIFAGVSMTPPA